MSFRFKQFIVKQERTAMKVGTDGVLLGAWTNCSNAKNVLDVGSGTGLISLMMAQKNGEARIKGVEIENDAYSESIENIENSQWKNRITIINSSLQNFAEQTTDTFDLIVSNPPFFRNSQLAENEGRNLARHTNSLNFQTLIQLSTKLLSSEGKLSIIIPSNEEPTIIRIAKLYNLFLTRKTIVKPKLNALPKRVLLELSRLEKEAILNELTIEISRHTYTNEYINLTKDFYLKM